MGVYVYRDLPKPFPDYKGVDLLDIPAAEGDGSTPTIELGVPCELTHYGCERIQNWGKGLVVPDEQMPESLVKAGIRYFSSDQNSLPWLFLGHIVAQCEVADPADAQLFFVPYPVVSLLRARKRDETVTREMIDAHYTQVKDFLQGQASWQRCDGCDHIISIEAPADRYLRIKSSVNGGYHHEDTFWSRVTRLGHHHGILDSRMNAKYSKQIEQPFRLPIMTVPFTTGFLPKSDAEMEAWLDYAFTPDIARQPSGALILAPRPNRMKMIRLCEEQTDLCSRAPHDRPLPYFRRYRDYTFSIQPGGDTPTRRGFFDSLLVGTIPIVFDPKAKIAGRADGFKEDVHQHYRLCYAKYFDEMGWGDGWIDKVALVAHDEEDAMRLIRDTPASQIAAMQDNIRRLIPRIVFWDHTAPASVAAAAANNYSSVSIVPTALRLVAGDLGAELRGP